MKIKYNHYRLEPKNYAFYFFLYSLFDTVLPNVLMILTVTSIYTRIVALLWYIL